MTRRIGSSCLVLISLASAHPALAKMSRAQEVELGRAAARDIERTNRVSPDKTLQERVKRIGQAIVEQLPSQDYPYQFTVLAEPGINAFCFPGGFMYYLHDLMARMPSDDALADIIAHEVTHAAHRHYADKVSYLSKIGTLATIGSVLIGDRNYDVASVVMNLTAMKYSRSDEYNADETAVRLIWQAGYKPQGAIQAISVLQKLESGDGTPRYLRSHPPAKDRLNHIRKIIDELEAAPRPVAASTTTPVKIDLTPLLGQLPDAVIAPNPFYPLAIGNEWQYDVIAGNVHAPLTITVESALSAPRGKVFRLETVRTRGGPTGQYALTTESSLWRKPSSQGAWSPDWIVPGNSEVPVTAAGMRYTLVGTESVSTPSGTYPNATHIRRESEGPGISLQDLWLVPGVGLVRRATKDPEVTEVLVRYSVGSEARVSSP